MTGVSTFLTSCTLLFMHNIFKDQGKCFMMCEMKLMGRLAQDKWACNCHKVIVGIFIYLMAHGVWFVLLIVHSCCIVF